MNIYIYISQIFALELQLHAEQEHVSELTAALEQAHAALASGEYFFKLAI